MSLVRGNKGQQPDRISQRSVTYFLRIDKKVLSLDVSLAKGFSSATGGSVDDIVADISL